uniref:M56 family metallopeptidase n=1 Tax=uncultured Anaerotruncus sp. TaxID=905011 RepID=UPI002586F3F9
MTAFFFSRVLPLSLTGAAVSALILAVSFLTRRQFGSRWRYYIWTVALALFFLPVTLPFPAGALSGVSEAISPAAAAVRFAAGPPTAAAETAAASAPLSWRELAALAWACGAAALLLQRAGAALRFHRALRRTSRPVADRETLALFAACKEELRVRRAVRLERCPLAGTPMLVGLLRPRVLLPGAPADPDALRFILLHELTHLKSGDLFYKLAGLAACVVHWFNPFAWLALHRINALCEPACDERLARPMDADERRGYGRAIL